MSEQQITTEPRSSGDKNDKPSYIEQERNWILHRNRGQPSPDPNEPIINQIKFYLDRYKIREATRIFFDENTLKLLGLEDDFMWDVIPLICRRLHGLCQYRFRVFEGCEKMLHRIAIDENCNPKEVLISFLSELSKEDDNVFRAMIRPLESTLLRMNHPVPRDENLRWIANILVRYITNIGIPREPDIDCKKRPNLRDDPKVKRYIEVLPLFMGFIETFLDQSIDSYNLSPPILTQSQIEGVLNGELLDEDPSLNPGRTSEICVTALMNLMCKPMTFWPLTLEGCLEMKVISNRYLSIILRLRPNLFSSIYNRAGEESKLNEQETSNTLSINESCDDPILTLATCCYIYRCERVKDPSEVAYSFPKVITHESMLACHMPQIVALLERSELYAYEKGLFLLESLLEPLNDNSLDRKFLIIFEKSNLLNLLLRITIFSPIATNRRKAYEAFTKICDYLTYDCKYKLFFSILNQTDLRPCVRATCIDQYRKHLTEVYRALLYYDQKKAETAEGVGGAQVVTTTTESVIAADSSSLSNDPGPGVGIWSSRYRHLTGQPLIDFLDLCMKACLPDLQNTDVIANYELILATLTMLRFLKLRKQFPEYHDVSAEDTYLTGIRLTKLFFDPIRRAMALITKDLKETQGIAKQDETDCLRWAFCRLDLIESVLVRTRGLYDC